LFQGIIVPMSVLVLAAMLIFPGPIGNAITRMTSFDCRLFHANFAVSVAKAEETASPNRGGPVGSMEDCAGVTEDREKLKSLISFASNNSKGAVMDAYREVELAMIGTALRRSFPVVGPAGRVSGSAAMESLRHKDVLSASMVERFTALRTARESANNVTYPVDEAVGTRYVCAALVLAEELRHL